MNVLVDVNHSFHKSFFIFKKTQPDYDLDDIKYQGILIRKAATDLMAAINKINIDFKDVYFCFDQFTWRKEVDSEYKNDRVEKEQGFYYVINRLYEFLLEKGYKAIRVNNLESDDIIAFLSKYLEGEKLIVSADEDLRQLISEEVFVWNNNNQKPICYFLNEFDKPKKLLNISYKEEIVDPSLILFKKVMLGCSGDNVGKLIEKRGIGEKTIEKFFYKNFEFMNDFLESSDCSFLKKSVETFFKYKRDDFNEKYLQNLMLVKLDPLNLPSQLLLDVEFNYEQVKILPPKINFTVEEILMNSEFFKKKFQ